MNKRTTRILWWLLAALLIGVWGYRRWVSPNRPAKVRVYLETYGPAAKKLSELSGIPAAIPLAVAGLESGWGESQLAQKGNNHFGIKARGKQKRYCLRTTEFKRGRPYRVLDCFRAYPSPEEGYFDFVRFILTQPRYEALFRIPPEDYRSWAKGLQEAGYATDPDYAKKLIRVIEHYGLDEL